MAAERAHFRLPAGPSSNCSLKAGDSEGQQTSSNPDNCRERALVVIKDGQAPSMREIAMLRQQSFTDTANSPAFIDLPVVYHIIEKLGMTMESQP
jgi:hypothetical protein